MRSLGQRSAECGPSLAIDRAHVVELAAGIAHESRLEFARSFVAATVLASTAADCHPPLPWVEASGLSRQAETAAEQIAAGIYLLPPAEAAYAVGSLYTALLPEEFRGQYGIFYTPPDLVERLLVMVDEGGIDWRHARVLDPACGGGAFLVGAAMRMAKALEHVEPAVALNSIGARLRGYDVDLFGGWLAQVAAAAALGPLRRSAGRDCPIVVEIRDSLECGAGEPRSFDAVVGNPPYGRVTLSPERRRRFGRSIYGHANLYGVFTDAALHWLKPGGVAGYVTPTSMLSGLYYRDLRALLAEEAPPIAVNFISERVGVFANVLQETMLATYRKGGLAVPATVGFIDLSTDRNRVSRRNAGKFTLPADPHAPWIVPRTRRQASLTRRLRGMPHRLADYGYGVSTGPLVWNRHKQEFRRDRTEGAFPVIWAEAVTSDGRFIWRSDRRNHVPWFAARPEKDDWLIVTQPCVLLQRTTAKEQSRRLIAAELSPDFIRRHGGVVVENHLNMVRAINARPKVTPAVIAALLNSFTADAAFRCLNGSVAVSAFELKELPLPAPSAMAKLARLVGSSAPRTEIEAAIASAYGERVAAAAA